ETLGCQSGGFTNHASGLGHRRVNPGEFAQRVAEVWWHGAKVAGNHHAAAVALREQLPNDLAGQRLLIEAALAGNENIRSLKRCIEARERGDNVGAADQLGAPRGGKTIAGAASSTSAGDPRLATEFTRERG